MSVQTLHELQAPRLLGTVVKSHPGGGLATSVVLLKSHGQRSIGATASSWDHIESNTTGRLHRHALSVEGDVLIKLIPASLLSLTGRNVYIHTRTLSPVYPNVILKGVCVLAKEMIE